MHEVKNPEQQMDKPSVEQTPEQLRATEDSRSKMEDDLDAGFDIENSEKTENPERNTAHGDQAGSSFESIEKQRENNLDKMNSDGTATQQEELRSKSCLDESKIREIQNIEKGQRPEPETYMSKEQIDTHLDQFKEGGSFVMTRDQYEAFVEGRDKIGLPDNSQYMTSKEYMDSIDKKANGDISVYEKELGFDPGHFEHGGGMVRVDVNEPFEHNARMPSGNEMGANEHFTPGGYTDGGAPECVTDRIPNNDECRKITFF